MNLEKNAGSSTLLMISFHHSMPSLESLLLLLRDFQEQKIAVEPFIEEFQEMYFNGRVFEHVPEAIKQPMENIVLAVGLTQIDDEERDEFGSAISPAALRHAIDENMALIDETLR